jgi:hypothetical protein
MPEEMFLNPNEPNPNFMLHKEEARRILLKTVSGKSYFFWLIGKTGIGKTTFLLWINQFAHHYKILPIYFHGGENLKLEDIKEEIEKKTKASFFSKVFLRKTYIEKPILLMIDDIDYIEDENIFKYVISKLDEEKLHISIIAASVESEDKVSEFLRGRDIEKITLEMPSIDTMIEMIRKRIEAGGGENFQPFGKQLVKDIIEASNTIREILKKLQEAL